MLYPVELRDRPVEAGSLSLGTCSPSGEAASEHPGHAQYRRNAVPRGPTLSRDLHNIAKMKNLLSRKTNRTGFVRPATKACGGLRPVVR